MRGCGRITRLQLRMNQFVHAHAHVHVIVRVIFRATHRSEHEIVRILGTPSGTPSGNCSDLKSLQVHPPQAGWIILGDVRVGTIGGDFYARGASKGCAHASSVLALPSVGVTATSDFGHGAGGSIDLEDTVETRAVVSMPLASLSALLSFRWDHHRRNATHAPSS